MLKVLKAENISVLKNLQGEETKTKKKHSVFSPQQTIY